MRSRRRFDLVIFDLDGTLIDNRVAIRDNFNWTLAAYGYQPFTDSQIDSMIGTPLIEMFQRTIPEKDRHLAPELVDVYRRRYHETGHEGVVILDDTISVLEHLRSSGFKLAVATTKEDNEAKFLVQKIGLSKHFDLITGLKKGFRNKPNPDMVQYVVTELGVDTDRTVFVGDTPIDIMTARNAGIYAIAVTSSVPLGMTTLDKIHGANPDVIIDSLRELPKYVYAK